MSNGLPASHAYLMLWGLIATVVMTSILEGARGLRFSRMSLPFLVGTFFLANRKWAMILGFTVYVIGGWLFAFLYYFVFASIGVYTWWFGALAGLEPISKLRTAVDRLYMSNDSAHGRTVGAHPAALSGGAYSRWSAGP